MNDITTQFMLLIDNSSFGYDRRKLSVEWARAECVPHRDGSKSAANQRPTKTLFIINFDPVHTRVRDIEKHFEPYGNVLHQAQLCICAV
ncbi:putative arginine/serine-rich-splicing factor RSP31/31A, RNA-binding domain superfamily [Helianthus annuus]|nr:putative arginine/serine-rich-splicing factor RSP31/31A, RNA-binding domain superfamily [Helianthus annuus]